MAKKSLGYVELEWECPFCGTRNPGTAAKCSNCGAPQPEDVKFQQAAKEEIVTDQKKIEAAKVGPDIICPYCGTRNPAGATTCSNCMGDLTDAARRQSGQVLGAFQDKEAPDVKCPFCGTMNPATAVRCSNCNGLLQKPDGETAVPDAPKKKRGVPVFLIVILIGLLCLCGILAVMFLRTEDVTGSVQSVNWTRSIAIEALGPVERSDWADQIPADASVGSCSERVRRTQANPAPNSVEVCGTPYTVDTGTGLGEVVQDCEYQVYDDFCEYTVTEWVEVDTAQISGADLNPIWPQTSLSGDQRTGAADESYEVVFSSDGERYTYTTSSLEEFLQFTPGSEWTLAVNSFGGVVDVKP